MAYSTKYVTDIEFTLAQYFKAEMFEEDSFAFKFFNEQSFVEGDTFTDAQRWEFWNIVIQNRHVLPKEQLEIVEQVAMVVQSQSKVLSKDINTSLNQLNYKLRLPFQIEEFQSKEELK